MADQLRGPGIETARILAVALAGGVTLFWIVGWILTGGGEEGLAPETLAPDLALRILLGAHFAGFAGALIFRGRAMGSGGIPARAQGEPGAGEAGRVQTNLIISWALLEAPALLSGVFFLLLAETQLLLVAVPVYALGVAVTFPRAAWFGEREARI